MRRIKIGEFTEEVFIVASMEGSSFDLCDIQFSVECAVIACMEIA